MVERVDGLRILADVELLETRQGVAVLGDQERDGSLLAVVREGDRKIVIAR